MTEELRPDPRSGLERFLGDRPMALLVRLLLISLFVGFLMTMFGFDAADLVHGATEAIRDVLRDGGGVFRQLGSYVVTGAAIVVPVWIVLRLLRAR